MFNPEQIYNNPPEKHPQKEDDEEEKDISMKLSEIKKIAESFGFEAVKDNNSSILKFDTLTDGIISFNIDKDCIDIIDSRQEKDAEGVAELGLSNNPFSYQNMKEGYLSELVRLIEDVEKSFPGQKIKYKVWGQSFDIEYLKKENQKNLKKKEQANYDNPTNPNIPPDKQNLSFDPHSGGWWGSPKK